MNLEICVAQAVNTDLDVVEAMPGIDDIPVELLEDRVHRFLDGVTERIFAVVRDYGQEPLEGRDARELARLIRAAGVRLPRAMLLKICERIIELYGLDLGLHGMLETGQPVFTMRMTVDLDSPTL